MVDFLAQKKHLSIEIRYFATWADSYIFAIYSLTESPSNKFFGDAETKCSENFSLVQ